MIYTSIDIFCGCGGLTQGLRDAGFNVLAALDNDPDAVKAFKLNHPATHVYPDDIRNFNPKELKKKLVGQKLHLLAGCPPCQGFSSVRRLNREKPVDDDRNDLVNQFLRLIEELRPLTIMMENVPGLKSYELFEVLLNRLKELKYYCDYDIVDTQNYGVPQRRKRLVLVGSKLGEIKIAPPTGERKTVLQTIGGLEKPENSKDQLHRILMQHGETVRERISCTPKDGGSRKDLPAKYDLKCHKGENIGFRDIYGRLRWNDVSGTITSGCLNPSKGRFLHPEQDRALTPREAALLQSFPPTYKFPSDLSKKSLATLIGNALPPRFSFIQSKNIKEHLEQHLA